MKRHSFVYALVFCCMPGFTALAQSIPQFDVQSVCRNVQPLTAEDRKPVQGCIRDEMNAQRQLRQVWKGTASARRQLCVSETQVGGMPSYVDVLTCLQMGSASTAPPRRRQR